MKLVTKEEFARLLLDETIPFDDRKSVVVNDFHIEIPPDLSTSESLLTFVYDYYIKAMEIYQMEKKRVYVKAPKKERKGTIKEWIINYIVETKELTLEQLKKAVNAEFEYSKDGKSPRTRIRKVLTQMETEKLILRDHEHNTIKFIG